MNTRTFFFNLLIAVMYAAPLYAGPDTVIYNNATLEKPPVADDGKELMETSANMPATFAIRHIGIRSVHTNAVPRIAMFGDTIIVTVTSMTIIEKRRSMENPIILYLNRMPFPGIVGHLAGAGPNQIRFILTRSYEDNEKWNKILRSGFINKSLYLGVGLTDGSLVTPTSFPLQFTLRTPAESVPFIILCCLLGGFTIFIVWKKKMLQEKISNYYIYSLSNVHLFFWTQIILLSYMLIWFVCDDMNSIDSSNLILLGISAGTAGLSTIIGTTNKKTKNAKGRPSRGFFNDILSDNQEYSMHRYQIFIFNCVIGAFFIYKTIGELKMPVLSDTILALLGISSATYTGIKAIASNNILKTAPKGTDPSPGEEKEKENKEEDEERTNKQPE